MRSQAQYTIHTLNDVVTSMTAPTNPYLGQLWMDTSTNPPTEKTWNGTAWVEPNNIGTVKSTVTVLTEKSAEFETSILGLTSSVSSVTNRVTTVENDVGDIEEDIETIQSDVSVLQQTTTEISAEVSHKVDETYGTSSSTFGWVLKSTGFYIYSNASTVLSVTSSGLSVSGSITATSGSLSNLIITGRLSFGGNQGYYIDPNYNDGSYYINLPGIRIDDASGAVFSGKLSAPSGTIGGFNITASSLYYGTFGAANSIHLYPAGSTTSKSIGGSATISGWTISSGAGFGVTKAGALYCNNATVSGKITATDGTFSNVTIDSTCTLYGYVYASGSETIKFYGTERIANYETWMGGNGVSSTISQTISGVTHTSNAYIKPMGAIVVPQDYSTFADDGMIFGVMEDNSFKTQNILSGICFYYSNNNGTKIYEVQMRCGDRTCLDHLYDGVNWSFWWGHTSVNSKLLGKWYPHQCSSSYIYNYSMNSTLYGCLKGIWFLEGPVYCGTATQGYLTSTTQNNVAYSYLSGTWYANQIFYGSYSGYHTRVDGDQVTFYYQTTQVGEMEAYTNYTDIQGTWKTNGNNWISSSDRNLKKDIQEIKDVYGDLFDKLKPVTFKWKNGTSGRTHTGFIAQDVKEATEECGLTTTEFGAYVHFDASEKDGEIIPETCGIRYEEIMPLNTWEIQKLKKRVQELERKIQIMEEEKQ